MKTPEEFLREKYQHNTDYENGKFGFFEVISILEEYQQQVNNLNIADVSGSLPLTEEDIWDKIDWDMQQWGMGQGECESLITEWKYRYKIALKN